MPDMSRAAGAGQVPAGGRVRWCTQVFLLPLIVGISLLAFALTVVISLSPTEAEMREDAALMAHLSGRAPQSSVGAHRPGRPRSRGRALVPAG